MTSSLYRTPATEVTAQLADVRGRYDQLTLDAAAVWDRPPAKPELSAAVGAALLAEARWLDGSQWHDWLAWCEDDAIVWVPLNTTDARAGDDQSLFLDDRRRLAERVWRFRDPNAWALVPAGTATRAVGAVEAWPVTGTAEQVGSVTEEVLVTSTLSLHYVRTGAVWHTAGRQIHRLRAAPAGSGGPQWRLVHKIMLLPGLAAGTPHLGWLL